MIVTSSAQSLSDLDSIRDWIARDDPERAGAYIDELIDACEELVSFPRMYKRVTVKDRRLLHQRTYDNYLILFEVRGEEVEIVTVRHGARLPIARH